MPVCKVVQCIENLNVSVSISSAMEQKFRSLSKNYNNLKKNLHI